jgi:hypothetical protein
LRLSLRRRERERDDERERNVQATLALPVVLDWLGRQHHPRVLDLGGAHGDNVAFLSRFGCRLEIVDLFAQLAEGQPLGETLPATQSHTSPRPRAGVRDLEQIVAQAMASSDAGGPDPVEPLDLVLAWDLFDYLAPAQVEAAYRGLCRHLRPGARLFAQISYVGNIPLRPRRLRIADARSLVWDAEAPRVRPSPRYTERQLLKRLPGMRVEQSFLLRNGYREIIASAVAPVAVEAG